MTDPIDNSVSKLGKSAEIYDWFTECRELIDPIWQVSLSSAENNFTLITSQVYTHPKAKGWVFDKYFLPKPWRKSTSEEVFARLEYFAMKVEENIDFDVYIGNKTGRKKEHELSIHFPYGTSKSAIVETLNIIEGIDIHK